MRAGNSAKVYLSGSLSATYKIQLSTVSTVRVPLLGATCTCLHELPSSSKYVQDAPTTGWNTGWEFSSKLGKLGLHNGAHHSLRSLLITGKKTAVGTAKDMLRHSNSSTALELYASSPTEQRIAPEEQVLNAILFEPNTGMVA
jgi:hypothetical protein